MASSTFEFLDPAPLSDGQLGVVLARRNPADHLRAAQMTLKKRSAPRTKNEKISPLLRRQTRTLARALRV